MSDSGVNMYRNIKKNNHLEIVLQDTVYKTRFLLFVLLFTLFICLPKVVSQSAAVHSRHFAFPESAVGKRVFIHKPAASRVKPKQIKEVVFYPSLLTLSYSLVIASPVFCRSISNWARPLSASRERTIRPAGASCADWMRSGLVKCLHSWDESPLSAPSSPLLLHRELGFNFPLLTSFLVCFSFKLSRFLSEFESCFGASSSRA